MRAQPSRWQWSDALDAQLEDLKAGALDRVSQQTKRLLSERPASLDLVIAVPSTVAHLAGVLGRPVWILVARPSEWRYLWNGERMPWYPSACLFRQEQPGDWTTVIARASVQLRDCAQTVLGNG